MTRNFIIFDLDGTVIDSSHRHSSKPDGSIDLEHWFDNATPEKVAQDTLLPLANAMRALYHAGHTIIICTARCFQPQDYKFLEDNNLPHHYLLKRNGRFVTPDHPEFGDSYYGFIGDGRGDAEMKISMLDDLACTLGFTGLHDLGAIMFDDNLAVIDAMLANRIDCHNAIHVNERLAA